MKSGRITLRMDPQLHADLAELAPKLGLDLNGLINLLVQEGLPAKREVLNRFTKPLFTSEEPCIAKRTSQTLNVGSGSVTEMPRSH